MTFDLPYWTHQNGTLFAYVVLTQAKNMEPTNGNGDFAFRASTFTSVKRFKLSKYKPNATSKYVNLLDASTSSSASPSNTNVTKKPITHLLSEINILTLDSQINFPNDQIPEELFHDIM